jgi:hypothetical protein
VHGKSIFFIEVVDKLRLFIDKNILLAKISVGLPSASMRTTQPILSPFWTSVFLGLERVTVKNLGSRLKPFISFHTKFWAFSGFLRIYLIFQPFLDGFI